MDIGHAIVAAAAFTLGVAAAVFTPIRDAVTLRLRLRRIDRVLELVNWPEQPQDCGKQHPPMDADHRCGWGLPGCDLWGSDRSVSDSGAG